ncbi:MAG: exopolyphosphatase [Thermoanaerobaculia bacterium]
MRLVTRGDLDGLTCAVLLTSVEKIEAIELVHPQELTDRRFHVMPGDILANLPYQRNAALWFDHHPATDTNATPPEGFIGLSAIAPSTARLVRDYYAEIHGPDVFDRFEELVAGTDKFDAARLSQEDVLSPRGVVLLGFTIDARTGLGSFRDYFMFLVWELREKSVAEVLECPLVVERVARMAAADALFRSSLLANSRVEGNVVVTDFRSLAEIPIGNRFLIYTLFPEANVSVRLQWGPRRESVMATVGHNIFDRSSWADIGQTMALFGGGGHRGAGSAPLPAADGDATLRRLIKELQL